VHGSADARARAGDHHRLVVPAGRRRRLHRLGGRDRSAALALVAVGLVDSLLPLAIAVAIFFAGYFAAAQS